MGIFDKLLKRKNKPEQKSKPDHQEDWAFYLTNVDDILGSIFLDLGFHKIAPLKEMPNVVWVSVKMNNPKQDGLSSSEEFETLKDLEDRLVSFVLENHDAIYVGRLTSNSKRDFFFYMGDSLLHDKTISEAMLAFPKYEYDFVAKEDAEWSNYLEFLYPLPVQFQSIQNRRVLDSLEKNGDKLTKERQVDHWIFFKSAPDVDSFLSKIKNDGFEIVDNDYDIKFGDAPFRLHISRIDKVDYNSVDDYVLYLWKLAGDCNGEYDGWETSVEKD